ncbi:MAG: TIGR04282 family arsenosugar biosynthesis glycosyltransferase [Alphaproteobacteria bacterium]
MTLRARRRLILFFKEPRMGSTKRRLARDVGPVAALRFYRANLRSLAHRLGRDPRWQTSVAVAPDRAAARPVALRRLGFAADTPIAPQGAGDLGARMARALHAASVPSVLIGGDIPGIAPADIERAFRALMRHELVLGPAADGGFWLVGVRRTAPLPRLFRGVRWSSRFALSDTLANLAPGTRLALLDWREDVDDGEAFARWLRAAPGGARRFSRRAL